MNYDALLKSILAAATARFLSKLVGSEPVEQLSVEFNSVDRRVPDMVVRLADGRILHLELQTSNDRKMARRMLTYRLLLRERYEDAVLEQTVLYVGYPPLAMPDGIDEPGLRYGFAMHDMREFDGRDVLRSPNPAERVLALLCGSPDPTVSVGEVLRSWSGLPRKELADLMEKLIMVSGLRRLDRVLEREVEDMPIGEEVLAENEFLRNWGEKLRKRGLEQGLEQGREQGLAQGVRRTLLRLIERRFGSVPPWAEHKVRAASAEAVEHWVLQAIDARSIEELLR